MNRYRSASRARKREISRPREKSFAKCCERLRRWRILAPQRRWNRTLIANEVSVTIHAQLLTVTFHFSGKLPRGRALAENSRASSHRAEIRGACLATTPA